MQFSGRLMKTMMSLLSVALLGAGVGAQSPRGYLFIVGGGPQPPELVQRFFELAGGKKAKIVVFAMASSEGNQSGEEKADTPLHLGAAIDESTALIVNPDGHWTVLGESAVSIYDARHATITPATAPALGESGLILSVLPSGSSYYPATGKVVLPKE